MLMAVYAVHRAGSIEPYASTTTGYGVLDESDTAVVYCDGHLFRSLLDLKNLVIGSSHRCTREMELIMLHSSQR